MTGKLIAGLAAVGLAGAAAYFYLKSQSVPAAGESQQVAPAVTMEETPGLVVPTMGNTYIEDRSINYSNAPTTHNTIHYEMPDTAYPGAPTGMPDEEMFKQDISPDTDRPANVKTNASVDTVVLTPTQREVMMESPTYNEMIAAGIPEITVKGMLQEAAMMGYGR